MKSNPSHLGYQVPALDEENTKLYAKAFPSCYMKAYACWKLCTVYVALNGEISPNVEKHFSTFFTARSKRILPADSKLLESRSGVPVPPSSFTPTLNSALASKQLKDFRKNGAKS